MDEKPVEPPRATGWGAHANALRKQGRHEEALAYLEGAHAAGADGPGLWQGIAITLVELRRFDAALEAADTAVARAPDDALGHTIRAFALAGLDRYLEAHQAAERALTRDPDQAMAWGIKADSLLSFGRLDEALVAAERATALDPDNGGLWRIQGQVLSELRRYRDALACFDQAVSIDPTNLGAWLGKATVHMDFGQYAQALEAFERARPEATRLGVAPDASTLLYTAQALCELGRHEEALEMAERGRALLDDTVDPTPAWYLAGRCLFALKRYGEALAAYEQALAHHPEVWAVRVRVIRTHCKLGRYRAALATLLSAARQRPGSGAV